MKILHFASGDSWAGAEVQLFHLVKKLALHKDVELLVVLLNHGQLESELRRYDVNIVVLEESRLSAFAVMRNFNKLVKEFQPDIIHTHRHKDNILGGFIAFINGKKSIRTVHGENEHPNIFASFRRFIVIGLDKLVALFIQQKIIAVTDELKEKLKKIFPASKLVTIENCVDIGYVENMSNETCEWSAGSESFNIAFIGRFVPVKRVDLFYNIAKALINDISGKNLYFHMLGDGPLKQEIEENLLKDGLESKIHLHGFVENVAPMLKQMDLLIFTSDHEGLPMALLEAMTLRVPVLSRQLLGIWRVLCDGECGYFVDSDAVDEYVKNIVSIMTGQKDVNTRVTAARCQIEQKYNIDINAEKYFRLYEEVLG